MPPGAFPDETKAGERKTMSLAVVAVAPPAEESVMEEAPAAKPVKFDFDAAFQSTVCALVVRDTTFVQRVDGLIKPEFFENGLEAAWVSIALRYFAKYRKCPATVVYGQLIREDVEAKIIDAAYSRLLGQHHKNVLMKADLSNRDYFADQVATFARHQAVSAAILESVPLIERHDFENVGAKLRRALDTGVNSDGDTYDYGEMLAARTGERLDKAAGKLPPAGITTGYAEIDEALYHKGWGRRELSCLMGGAKAGKTTALIHFAKSAVASGKNVLYVTLEVSSKIIAERLDANVSSTPVMELTDHVHAVREQVHSFLTKANARFAIKEFPTGSMRVSDLRRLLERFKARGTVFDMVVVDYADLIAPERHSDSSIENSKSVYVALRGLAMEQDLAVLTAMQTNRDGFKAAVAKAEHAADDFNKIRIADIVISINRTEEERAAGTCRLYFAASRNQPGGFTIRVEQNMNAMQFVTRVVGYE
jgi:replicative DNA helicase